MTNRIKSGKVLLDDFFSDIGALSDVDPYISEIIKRLYNDGTLTATNIANELELAREAKNSSETE